MARVYDIVEKIKSGNERPKLKIDEEHSFEINTSKNTAIFIQAMAKDENLDEMERMDKIVESALGKEALDYINSLGLSINVYATIITAINAAIGDISLEEAEKLAKDTQKKFRK